MTESIKLKDTCERCGFVPIDMCQLGAIYIDGRGKNDDLSSHMTLCANCQSFLIAMHDRDLSTNEREEVKEAWRQGKFFN